VSDRHSSLTVALDDDYRAEDIEALMQSIRMLRGVADVTMTVNAPGDYVARSMIRSRVQLKLYEAIRKAFDP